MKVIPRLKLKVDTSYYHGRGIYNNIDGGVYPEPCCLADMEHMVYLTRISLERKLRDLRLRTPEIMKVFVLREDLTSHNKLTVLYEEIGIKPLNGVPTGEGMILYITNPQNPTPCSKQVMDGWKLRKFLETKDVTYLGVPAPLDVNDLFPREIKWTPDDYV
ncbi:MAG: hypothetical protein JRN26_04715 [Nitrososphaerota archaeon]|jgi:hypothetical protein|nr:hypothetical protein [Nitrososphaerota archaeon]MDG6927839.1 hypothetical protein [Nitrososphaerota archaeon]MDG6931267.1 hypothetical protein [Nitrososphaerota archaeon]MDG6932134.1 hypothetical protein [Nitrososphaerota archaeon]MDG6936167.1 hypothetical protein [Nitrososphaerota archaeon]